MRRGRLRKKSTMVENIVGQLPTQDSPRYMIQAFVQDFCSIPPLSCSRHGPGSRLPLLVTLFVRHSATLLSLYFKWSSLSPTLVALSNAMSTASLVSTPSLLTIPPFY